MKLSTKNYDVYGMSAGRLLRGYFGDKLRPFSWFGNELELRHLSELALRHWLGYPIAYLTMRYNRQWNRLLRAWRDVGAKLRRNEPEAD